MPHLAYRDESGKAVYVELGEKEITIGREADCDLVLSSKAVSRHHARIFRDGNRWRIADAGSLHGTFVNRLRLKEDEPILSAGDQIAVGSEVITFEPGPVPTAPATEGGKSPEKAGRKPSASGRGMEITPLSNPLPPEAIKIRLGQSKNRDELLRTAVDLAMHMTAANRGVIALRDKGEKDFATVCSLVGPRREPPASPIPISQTFVERLVKERVPLIARDTDQDLTLSGAHSILKVDIRSVLGAPLLDGEALVGYLYLDTLGDGGLFRGRIFRKVDLEAVGTIARLTSAELLSRAR